MTKGRGNSIDDATPADWYNLKHTMAGDDYGGTTCNTPSDVTAVRDVGVSFNGKDWGKWGANKESTEHDDVNHPKHYNTGAVECIEAIEASMTAEAYQGYLKGNTLKYLWRFSYKGKAIQDLEKAQWYLNKLLNSVSCDE
jgi:hypothetical protein